ncbi:hypothetical protein QJ48_14150 [Paenibacillus sp. A3]|uniref:hypothetical protein n=1 Tax=Paenibacillus sp. A3 TaxID=1337054 RepID=UPI0006D52BD3|nr:hypothetical protein [Paenibacillus sp. A3]KPV58863.1 hypothetical protein QJ48_14150 [Paenibacillus sp. A3]
MKREKMKMFPVFVLATGLVVTSVTPNVLAAESVASKTVSGGWSEKSGYFTTINNNQGFSILAASEPKHEGYVESRREGSTVLLKRAVGKTTWKDTRHYTRARFEGYWTGEIKGDSGRVWGTGSTEAKSDWIDKSFSDWVGKTYYGNEE